MELTIEQRQALFAQMSNSQDYPVINVAGETLTYDGYTVERAMPADDTLGYDSPVFQLDFEDGSSIEIDMIATGNEYPESIEAIYEAYQAM